MDLDELQSVQSRERQTDSLQQLRASFYKEAGECLETLRAHREPAADRADDPWNSPEVSRLSDDIETAEQTVEAIYERRVGKVVKMASLAAADMPTEDDGLTEEEEQLFETLVGSIEENRSRVEAVLGGENPAMAHEETQADDPATVSETPPADGATRAETGRSEPVAGESPTSGGSGETEGLGSGETEASVDAADLMGAGPVYDGDERAPSSGKPETGDQTPPPEPAAETTPTPPDSAHPPGERDGESRSGPAEESPTSGPASETGTERQNRESPVGNQASDQGEGAGIDRETVRIKSEVGEIYGVDDRSYELSADDVVSLPAANATPLLEDDAAERLE
jgi:DNA replication factor GINS